MKKCHTCLNSLDIKTPVGRREVCSFCGTDLRCCLNCVFHDTVAYNECREPQAERVLEKDRSNYCDFFVFREAVTEGKRMEFGESTKTKIESLFKTG